MKNTGNKSQKQLLSHLFVMLDLSSLQTHRKMCAKAGVRKEQIHDTTENEYLCKINWGQNSLTAGT